MSNAPAATLRRGAALAAALWLALTPASPAAADREPVGRGAEQAGPGDLREQLFQHRQAEAAAKARALAAERLAAAPAALTPNQGLYDVRSYDLDLSLDPGVHLLTGRVVVHALVTGASISSLDLDLRPKMGVTAVRAGGAPATYSRAGDVLTIALGRTYVAAGIPSTGPT
jgi:hypothetical protein